MLLLAKFPHAVFAPTARPMVSSVTIVNNGECISLRNTCLNWLLKVPTILIRSNADEVRSFSGKLSAT